jgi:hypothetical protein
VIVMIFNWKKRRAKRGKGAEAGLRMATKE